MGAFFQSESSRVHLAAETANFPVVPQVSLPAQNLPFVFPAV